MAQHHGHRGTRASLERDVASVATFLEWFPVGPAIDDLAGFHRRTDSLFRYHGDSPSPPLGLLLVLIGQPILQPGQGQPLLPPFCGPFTQYDSRYTDKANKQHNLGSGRTPVRNVFASTPFGATPDGSFTRNRMTPGSIPNPPEKYDHMYMRHLTNLINDQDGSDGHPERPL